MRRRSERKKSTDISSPVVARRSGRRRKSPSISESEKNEECNEVGEEAIDNKTRASSEEHENDKSSRRGRRKRTPVNSPKKRKNQRTESSERKIDDIPEEENIVPHTDEINAGEKPKEDGENSNEHDKTETTERAKETEGNNTDDTKAEDEGTSQGYQEEVTAEQINEDVKEKEVIGYSRSLSPKAIVDEKMVKPSVSDSKEDSPEEREQAMAIKEDEPNLIKNQYEQNEKDKSNQVAGKKNIEKIKPIVVPAEESRDSEYNGNHRQNTKSPARESGELDSNENSIQMDTNSIEAEKSLDINSSQISNTVRIQRKRKWLSKKAIESKTPILAISTDSLKGLISDVHPVPLSDVRLDSSSDIEEVASEREEGEKTPSPKRNEEVEKVSTVDKPIIKRTISKEVNTAVPVATATATIVKVQRSPSPARNKTSNVLYITNLVRPFTVMQLKSLLARTGKIVEDGFWIDRIKSKCYVQYETEDEAIETRHALHGVRWPVSNPKCLNVDFGKKADMDRAIESTKDDAPKLGQDNKDNVIVGSGWNRGERTEEIERKSARPVREWDVGKRENLDREREKNRETVKRRSRERDISANRENEKTSSDRKERNRERRERTRSPSPIRKMQKKDNEPPLRLLDDLFRKTKASPCIYWLPLTPEQIAEKEALRQKRIIEHQERVKQRELERERERENRNRNDRDRRNRSSDRRRSRSRDRRRY